MSWNAAFVHPSRCGRLAQGMMNLALYLRPNFVFPPSSKAQRFLLCKAHNELVKLKR